MIENNQMDAQGVANPVTKRVTSSLFASFDQPEADDRVPGSAKGVMYENQDKKALPTNQISQPGRSHRTCVSYNCYDLRADTVALRASAGKTLPSQ